MDELAIVTALVERAERGGCSEATGSPDNNIWLEFSVADPSSSGIMLSLYQDHNDIRTACVSWDHADLFEVDMSNCGELWARAIDAEVHESSRLKAGYRERLESIVVGW